MAAGDAQAQVAADFGLSRRHVLNIVRAAECEAQAKRERRRAARKIRTDCGVIHGDFREANVPDESVGMIFTDPPYDDPSIPIYSDLARFAARVLIPGGWVVAYCANRHLPRIFQLLDVAGLQYGWTFTITHTGGDARFPHLPPLQSVEAARGLLQAAVESRMGLVSR